MAIPLDKIAAQAREVDLRRVVLTVLAALLYAPGWLVGKVFLGVVWACVAVKVGFVEARGPRPPSRAG